jgi:hypothetical protein
MLNLLIVAGVAMSMSTGVPPLANSPAALTEPAADSATGVYWVAFRTKVAGSQAQVEAAIAEVARQADPRQVSRRQLRRTDPGLFDERDLPVRGEDVAAVAATGARVRATSRWLNAVSVEATDEQVALLRNTSNVVNVWPVAIGRRPAMIEREVPVSGGATEDQYGYAGPQLGQMNLPALHAAGFTGAGVRVGVLDTGFVTSHVAFNGAEKPLNVVAAYDFVKGDANVGIEPGDDPDQHRHGTWILGTMAAYLPGTLVGGAFDAEYVLCKTEDYSSETPIEEDNYVAGLEWAESLGADLATSSLGYIDWYTQSDLNGTLAVTTQVVNIATANGMHCCTAAGNEGNDADPATSHLIAPADALRVITCGAVDGSGAIANFSSDGPTADGRVKPEILAQGVNTLSVSSSTNTNFAQVSGTSLSTPLVAAAVACLTQAHPSWTPDQMRRALFQSASGGGVADPLFVRGYGILNAFEASRSAVCAGDLNGNGEVEFLDFLFFFNCFDQAVPCGDLSGDGTVDFFDFLQFFNVFDTPC